jgi:DNA-binding transcriptional LysR family regulator
MVFSVNFAYNKYSSKQTLMFYEKDHFITVRMSFMELNQLEYFKTLAHINHFTQAAQSISVSQPALSRSIAKLEKELGVPLFNRVGKKIHLTPYGQNFLIHTERVLQELANAKQEIVDLSEPDQGIINLSFLHSLGTTLVPMLLSNFRKKYPKIQFKLNQDNSARLTDQLIKGATDLCLCSTLMTTESLGWVSLCAEDLFIILPAKHPLAKRHNLRLEEIVHEPFITFKPMYSLRLLADQFFEAAAIRPNITFEGDEIMTVASLVAANLGVALIPHIPGLEHLDLVFIPVSRPICARAIGIAWNTNNYLSPATRKFQQFVIDTFIKEKTVPLAPYIKTSMA